MILSPILIGGRCLIIPLPKRKQRMERQKEKRKSRRKLAISAALSGLLYLALEESIKKFIEYLFSSLTGSK